MAMLADLPTPVRSADSPAVIGHPALALSVGSRQAGGMAHQRASGEHGRGAVEGWTWFSLRNRRSIGRSRTSKSTGWSCNDRSNG